MNNSEVVDGSQARCGFRRAEDRMIEVGMRCCSERDEEGEGYIKGGGESV